MLIDDQLYSTIKPVKKKKKLWKGQRRKHYAEKNIQRLVNKIKIIKNNRNNFFVSLLSCFLFDFFPLLWTLKIKVPLCSDHWSK